MTFIASASDSFWKPESFAAVTDENPKAYIHNYYSVSILRCPELGKFLLN